MPAAYPRRSCRGKAGHLPRQTVHGERGNRAESDRYRSSALSAVGLGKGRSLCSSPRAGKPLTWRREAASCAVGYWKNRRTPVNASASWPEAEQARNRVLEIQTKLHRWAVTLRSHGTLWRAGCVVTRTSGSEGGPENHACGAGRSGPTLLREGRGSSGTRRRCCWCWARCETGRRRCWP